MLLLLNLSNGNLQHSTRIFIRSERSSHVQSAIPEFEDSTIYQINASIKCLLSRFAKNWGVQSVSTIRLLEKSQRMCGNRKSTWRVTEFKDINS